MDLIFINKIRNLYSTIDAMYEVASRHYAFSCEGCDAHCCKTRFYHYTCAEFLYLKAGFDTLDSSKKEYLKSLAHRYESHYLNADEESLQMCPLNEGGLCILYEWRPMICRLHGLPSETQDINMTATFYGGCESFIRKNLKDGYVYMTINRTIYYREMAKIEHDLRASLGISPPERLTVSGMILRF
ncbi:MAG: hypothetical protein SNJ53_06510 [Thermodesulfovibrionales bacterium]